MMMKRSTKEALMVAANQNIKEREYWFNKLAGDLEKTGFPYDLKKNKEEVPFQQVEFKLTHSLFSRLMKLSNQSDDALNMILISGLVLLLNKYTGNRDIIVGAPIYKQDIEEDFVNTVLALRNRVRDDMTFIELLLQVKQTVKEAEENQNYPIEVLITQLNIPALTNEFPLFDIAIMLENIHDRDYLRDIRLNMIFSFLRTDECIESKLEFNPLLYKNASIKQIIAHFTHLLQETIFRPNLKISELDLLTDEVRKQLLIDFNDTEVSYPGNKNLPGLFAEQAQKTPDNIAVIGPAPATGAGFIDSSPGKQTLQVSYRELNEKSNYLAALLKQKGVQPDTIVGIMIERSIDMTIGLMGILNAGGAYLPIDPGYPEDRIDYMLKDSSAAILVSEESKVSKENQADETRLWGDLNNVREVHDGIELILLDKAINPFTSLSSYSSQQTITSPSVSHMAQTKGITPTHLCYTLYTSGTTGRPKGVLVEQRSVVNVVTWFSRQYHLQPGSHVLNMSDYTFDASVNQVFATLLHGAVLHIISKNLVSNIRVLRQYINMHQIHIINFVPSLLNELLGKGEKLASLRAVISGAEALDETIKNKLIQKGYALYNQYGLTETTIDALAEKCSKKKVTLGKPISNVQCYILDEKHRLLPAGIAGELYVAGTGLARGYLNNPELTAEKFDHDLWDYQDYHDKKRKQKVPGKIIPHSSPNDRCPMTNDRSYKLYQTGDLARWLPDGTVEFLGRFDQQVKIRGYRIETLEIQRQLLLQPQVKDAVVIPVEMNGEKYLCAYIVPGKGMKISRLKEALSRHLPVYMVPTYFVSLPGIPITASGKLDRKALPEPDIVENQDIIVPRDEVEMKLAEVWSEILGISLEKIGIDSGFFELGGQSLKAAAMAAEIHKAFHVNCPLASLFELSTIRKLAKYIKEAATEQYNPIRSVEKREHYPLSSAQKRLYIVQQMDLNSIAYNIPFILNLQEGTDIHRLLEIFKQLIGRHEILRTSFIRVDDEPVQRVHDEVEFEIKEEKNYKSQIRNKKERSSTAQYSDPKSKELISKSLISSFIRPFDLSHAPLIRVGLIQLEEKTHLLLIDRHHIITDGTSQQVMTKEFLALVKGEDLPLQRLQYKDYTQWWNRSEQQELIKPQENFWLQVFADELPILDLPMDHPRPAEQSFEGDRLYYSIDAVRTSQLKSLASKENVTLFILFLALLNVLLAKLSGKQDIIMGTPIAGRGHVDLQSMVGMLANTLALRNFPSHDKSFLEFLTEVKTRTLKAYNNQDYPFDELVTKLSANFKQDVSRNPVFDVMWVFHNESEPISGEEINHEEDRNYRDFDDLYKTSKFDIVFHGRENENRIDIIVEYCTRLFNTDTIQSFVNQLDRIIASIIAAPGQKISRIDVLGEKKKKEILAMSMGPGETVDLHKTVHEWFEEQPGKIPDHIAVVVNETQEKKLSLTYKELNGKSNQLACLLREKGVQPGTIVAIMAERSLEMIAGILAILKAGAGYLPIDEAYPGERKKIMLEDSSADLLLTFTSDESRDFSTAVPQGLEIIDLGDKYMDCSTHSDRECVRSATGGDILYVIYTSGSTAAPKGVILEHRSLVNLIQYQLNHTNIDFTKVLQFATISFDVSAQEIFSTLLAGGILYVVSKEIREDINRLFNVVRDSKIKTLFLPAAYLKFITTEEDYIDLIPSGTAHIVTAGEQVIVTERFKKLLNTRGIFLHNHYGPSESHVVTALTLEPGDDIPGLPPIGKPISNTAIYILDSNWNLQPIGVPGELYIGGIQVGRGYLNNPEMTCEKFDHDLWDLQDYQDKREKIPGKRIHRSYTSHMSYFYKTGDLARWLKDGNLEFLGRADTQVKIRGFRVELGEIETRLMELNRVKDAVVMVRETGKTEKYLCAYVVLDDTASRDSKPGIIEELRKSLSRVLPGYMVPAYFVPLDSIPVTANGKVNRRVLPEPDPGRTGGDYIAPGTPIEKKLTEIWAEVLALESSDTIGIDDNFFEMGGHSLRATIMASKIHRALKVKIPLAMIFKIPTIRQLCQYITGAGEGKFDPLKTTEKKEYYPLSSAQKRLYVQQQLNPNNTGYNISQVGIFVGRVDKEKFVVVFRSLIHRHESLRTSFHMKDNEPVQKVHDNAAFNIEHYDLRVTGEGDRLEGESFGRVLDAAGNHNPESQELISKKCVHSFIRFFDLSKAPLLRVGLIELEQEKHILMVDTHHIITDGTSMSILVEEFMAFYSGKELSPLRLQYRDYSQWQAKQSNLNDSNLRQQEEYWLNQFKDGVPRLNFPMDYPRPGEWDSTGDSISFVLDEEVTAKIQKMVLKTGTTFYIVLLAVITVLLSKYTARQDIVVGTGAAGRTHADLEHVIGMFVNMLAIRNHLREGETFCELLEEVKKNALTAFENQDYQFEELVKELNLTREPGRNPLFDVEFTFQNFPVKDLDIEGLTLKPYSHWQHNIKFDLSLHAAENNGTTTMKLFYATRLFKPSTIEDIKKNFIETLEQVTAHPGIKLEDIKISYHLVAAPSNPGTEQIQFDF